MTRIASLWLAATLVAGLALAQSGHRGMTLRPRRGGNPGADPPNGMVVTLANATTLATTLLGSGITLSGTPTLQGAAAQAGTFTNAPALVGFSSGIILSSGNVADAAMTWAGSDSPDTDEGQGGNAMLSGLISNQATFDAAVLTFSFIPNTSTIYFNYIMASAEWPNFIGQFNDPMGLFVNGTNVAVLPGLNIPVTINNVNAANHSQFFNKYNGPGDLLPYGGETKVLTATANVNAGQVNTIVLGVADALDHALDTAVLIQAGSITTTPPPTTPPPTVPLPPSVLLAITGIALSGLYTAYRMRRRRA